MFGLFSLLDDTSINIYIFFYIGKSFMSKKALNPDIEKKMSATANSPPGLGSNLKLFA